MEEHINITRDKLIGELAKAGVDYNCSDSNETLKEKYELLHSDKKIDEVLPVEEPKTYKPNKEE